MRELVVRPRPQPRLALRAVRADGCDGEGLIPNAQRAIGKIVEPLAATADALLKLWLEARKFIPAGGYECRKLLV